MAEIIKLASKEDKKFQRIIDNIPKNELSAVLENFANELLAEVQAGVNGEIDYKDSPFFEFIDKMYEELNSTDCYFCDQNVDPNAEEFNSRTPICIMCQLKIKNLFQAYNIDVKLPQIWLPGNSNGCSWIEV